MEILIYGDYFQSLEDRQLSAMFNGRRRRVITPADWHMAAEQPEPTQPLVTTIFAPKMRTIDEQIAHPPFRRT